MIARAIAFSANPFLNTVASACYFLTDVRHQPAERTTPSDGSVARPAVYPLKDRNEFVTHGRGDFGFVAGRRELAGVWIDAEGEDVVGAVVASD